MNEERLRAMFAAIDGRDWAALRAFFTDDVVYERPGYEPIRGLEDLLHFYGEVRVIASGEHQLTEVVMQEHAGACWGRFVGKHRNGSALDERFADCYTFRDGRIAHRVSYFFRPAV